MSWEMDRAGHVTGSQFATVMTKPKDKKAAISKTSQSYMDKLLYEHRSGKSGENKFQSFAMKQGTSREPEALEAFVWQTGVNFDELGKHFHFHETEDWIGSSSDGLNDNAVVEIKCPDAGKHMEYLRHIRNKECPPEHVHQLQGNMWVTGRDCGYFATYNPDLPGKDRLGFVEVPVDTRLRTDMSVAVVKFRDEMLRQLEEIRSIWGDPLSLLQPRRRYEDGNDCTIQPANAISETDRSWEDQNWL